MKYIIICFIVSIMTLSFWQFISFRQGTRQRSLYKMGMSFELFYTLVCIYCIVMIGFGLIYFLLSFYNGIIVEIGQVQQNTVKERLFRSLYFSGVTMLTIGYGDIIPIGIGRLIAIVQALIGYILPASFVLKLVHINLETSRDKSR